jgi:hypothetical protein
MHICFAAKGYVHSFALFVNCINDGRATDLAIDTHLMLNTNLESKQG